MINLFELPFDINQSILRHEAIYPREYTSALTFSEKISQSEVHDIVLDTNDGRAYFLIRYFAYPKKVYLKSENRHPNDARIVTY